MKVAIVGGGFTGVAAATSLVEAKVPVTLFERNSQLGGLASGFRARGWRWSLERYYHHWFRSDTWVSRYAKTWGVDSKVEFHRPVTVSETESHGFVQLDSPLSLLQYPELPFVDKFRMGMVLAYIKMLRDWRPLEAHSAMEWCARTMGARGFEAIWKPLLVGKFGEKYASQVNMAWFWSRLACRTSELGTYRGGFADMFEDVEQWLLSQGVDVRKSQGDIAIAREGDEWKITSRGVTDTFSHLVVAASPGAFASLCGSVAPQYTQTFVARPALGVQVVILSLKKRLGSHYWYSLRKGPQKPFLALIEHTNFVPPENFSGENIVYLADYVATDGPEWNRTDDELRALALAACRRVNPAVGEEDVNEVWVMRDAYAQPVMPLNASRDLPPLVVDPAQNLIHASMNHVYPWDRGTNFALELGHRVAQTLLKK